MQSTLLIMIICLCFSLFLCVFSNSVFGNIEGDIDRLATTNICQIAFINNESQGATAIKVIQNALKIPRSQSKVVSSDTNILSEFHEFAKAVNMNRVSLFVVNDLHSIDLFISQMNFLHSVTDSNSPYNNIVVLLLWNMKTSNTIDMTDETDGNQTSFILRWKSAVVSSWNQRNRGDANGDAIIGRISRMALFPVDKPSLTKETTTIESLCSFQSINAFGMSFSLLSFDDIKTAIEQSYLDIIPLLPKQVRPHVTFIGALALVVFLLIGLFTCFCCCCCRRRKKLTKFKDDDLPSRRSSSYSAYSDPPSGVSRRESMNYPYDQQQQQQQQYYGQHIPQQTAPPMNGYNPSPYASSADRLAPRTGSSTGSFSSDLGVPPTTPIGFTQRTHRPTPSIGQSPSMPPISANTSAAYSSIGSTPNSRTSSTRGDAGTTGTPVIPIGGEPSTPGRSIRKRTAKGNDAYDLF